jgi:Flp pilus assembly protein TadD
VNTFALTGKGDYLFKLGNYTGAIVYADKALETDPNNRNALHGKGVILNELNNRTISKVF